MLKRQRPVTPPPSSLGDPSSFFPDVPVRPLQQSHPVDLSQPRFKRQRIRPPPLDGALRGWLESESTGLHWESDGEEDWIEDAHDVFKPPLPTTTTVDQYKDANSLLHELHVINQHRLLFAHSPRDRRLNPSHRVPLPSAHAHIQDPLAGQRTVDWTNGSPYHSTSPQLARDRPAGRSCCMEPAEEKGLVEEVQCVRQRYEDANRYYPFF